MNRRSLFKMLLAAPVALLIPKAKAEKNILVPGRLPPGEDRVFSSFFTMPTTDDEGYFPDEAQHWTPTYAEYQVIHHEHWQEFVRIRTIVPEQFQR